jgi:hypothetical protein
LADDATLEEVIERLCFLAKVEEGLRQSTEGRVSSNPRELSAEKAVWVG